MTTDGWKFPDYGDRVKTAGGGGGGVSAAIMAEEVYAAKVASYEALKDIPDAQLVAGLLQKEIAAHEKAVKEAAAASEKSRAIDARKSFRELPDWRQALIMDVASILPVKGMEAIVHAAECGVNLEDLANQISLAVARAIAANDAAQA